MMDFFGLLEQDLILYTYMIVSAVLLGLILSCVSMIKTRRWLIRNLTFLAQYGSIPGVDLPCTCITRKEDRHETDMLLNDVLLHAMNIRSDELERVCDELEEEKHNAVIWRRISLTGRIITMKRCCRKAQKAIDVISSHSDISWIRKDPMTADLVRVMLGN